MIRLILFLSLSIFATAPNAQAADPLTVRTATYCGEGGAGCTRQIDMVLIDPTQYSFGFLTGGNAGQAKQSTRAFYDSLYSYALNSNALGVFSAGLLRDVSPPIPYGGFRIDNFELSGFDFGWRGSGLFCLDRFGNPFVIGEREALERFSTCLQSGPYWNVRQSSKDRVQSTISPKTYPGGFWDQRMAHSVITQLTDGKIVILLAYNHSFGEVMDFMKTMNFNGHVPDRALGLTAENWASFILRTERSPIVKGGVNLAHPSAIAVFGR